MMTVAETIPGDAAGEGLPPELAGLPFTTWMNVGAGLLCAALAWPMIQRRVKPNAMYGVRFSSSFDSDEHWYEHNALGGRVLLGWSVVVVALGVLAAVHPSGRDPAWVLPYALAPMLYLVGAIQTWFGTRAIDRELAVARNLPTDEVAPPGDTPDA